MRPEWQRGVKDDPEGFGLGNGRDAVATHSMSDGKRS